MERRCRELRFLDVFVGVVVPLPAGDEEEEAGGEGGAAEEAMPEDLPIAAKNIKSKK